jgi:hypothetical protein
VKYERHFERLTGKLPHVIALATTDTLVGIRKRAPRRSGKYAASIDADVKEHGKGWTVTVGSPLSSARIHERGGVIRARRAPYLVFNPGGGVVKVESVVQKGKPHLGPGSREWPRNVAKRMREVVGK